MTPRFAHIAAVAALYLCAAVAGLQLPYVGTSVSLIWAPTGIALAAFLRLGPSALPAVFVGAALTNLSIGASLPSALAIAFGNTLGPWCGAWLLRNRFSFQVAMGRPRDVWALFFFGALLPMMIPPTMGATVLCLDGRMPWSAYSDLWTAWWLGDAVGVLFAAPALLTASKQQALALFGRPGRLWFALSALATLLLSLAAFSSEAVAPDRQGALAYLTLAFLIWASLRWGMFGSSLLLFVATTTAAASTALGRGPFAMAGPQLGLALLWSFVAVASLSSFLMTSLRLERDHTEARLRESERRLATVIGSLPGLVYRCKNDHDWTMEFVSEQALAITGHPAECLVAGHPTFSEVIAPEDRALVWDAVQTAVGERRPFQLEYRIRTADGRQKSVLERGTPVWNAQGTLIALEGIIFDNTERKQIEEALVQAQKMDAVGRLAGGMAHDLNNVLVAIIGFAEMIRDATRADDHRRQKAESILQAADRAADMTHQLLAYSRKQVLKPQLFALSDVLKTTTRLLERLIPENIAVTVDARATGHVNADPTQLQQVIMNLMLNGRDAMPTGGTLHVATEDLQLSGDEAWTLGRLSPGAYVMLIVSDSGAGMEPEVRAHAFEPFFTTKDVGKGTGLGLATVYGVVKQSGGEVFLTSELGQGTTFRVLLKLGEGQPVPPVAASLRPLSTGGHEHILLIEDEPLVRDLAAHVLRDEGYRVTCAADGKAALTLTDAEMQQVDLVVTDVILPGMSGPDIVRSLAARRPGLRVLFVSGHPRDEELSAGSAVWDYLEKPFRPTALTGRVRALLDMSPSQPAPARAESFPTASIE